MVICREKVKSTLDLVRRWAFNEHYSCLCFW